MLGIKIQKSKGGELKLIESNGEAELDQRRKIERNNLIDIHFWETIFLFSSPTRVSSVKMRWHVLIFITVRGNTVKSVCRAQIYSWSWILLAKAPQEKCKFHVATSDTLGQNREQLKLKLKYISKQKLFYCTKHEVAATMKILLMDFIHSR